MYGIPGIQPNFIGVLEQRERLLLVKNPFLPFRSTVRHRSKNDLRYLETRVS